MSETNDSFETTLELLSKVVKAGREKKAKLTKEQMEPVLKAFRESEATSPIRIRILAQIPGVTLPNMEISEFLSRFSEKTGDKLASVIGTALREHAGVAQHQDARRSLRRTRPLKKKPLKWEKPISLKARLLKLRVEPRLASQIAALLRDAERQIDTKRERDRALARGETSEKKAKADG
jgi:hypothetical protein